MGKINVNQFHLKQNQIAQKNPPKKRSVALDGMKGVMILAIIVYYYFQNYLPGGFLAVNSFFVFAGYLAFRFNKQLFHRDRVDYHVRKTISRLWYPMLWMILVVGAYIFITDPEKLKNLRYMAVSSLMFVNNYYQIVNQQSYFVQSLNPSPFVHLWYVSLYLQLILLSVGLRKVFAKSNLLRMQEGLVLLMLAIASACWLGLLYWYEQDPSHAYYALSTRMFAFMFGGALSYFCDGQLSFQVESKGATQMSIQLLGIATLIAMIALMFYFNGTQASTYYIGMQLFTLITLGFVASGLCEKTILNYLLRFRGFTALGRRSFSYYLWFYPIHLLIPARLTALGLNKYSFFIQVIMIALLSEISYRIFEIHQFKVLIGQEKSFISLHRFWESDISLSKKLFGVVFSFAYIVIGGIGVVGLAQSSEGKNQVAEELEETIKRNQELVQQPTKEDSRLETATTLDEKLQNKEKISQMPVTFVGDSILLAAADKIQELFPKSIISGKIGRQLYSSHSTLLELEAQGKLMDTVITFLGTNGAFSNTQLEEYIKILGQQREIYFVTIIAPVNWANEVNQQFQEAAAKYTNVHVYDWASVAKNHPEWFYEDQTHPNNEGASQLSEFILEHLAMSQNE